MSQKIFSASPFYPDFGLAIVRILTGMFMIYHGWEVFDAAKMGEYEKWMTDLKFPSPALLAYIGKSIELVSGIFLALGLFTRLVLVPLALTMLFISFGLGKGRIFMEEQHPFLFVLLCFLFFFTGPGRWSLDNYLFRRTRSRHQSNY